MTQDEIIEMADKAKLGSKAHFGFVIYQTSGTKELEAFAKLVAAKAFPDGVDAEWVARRTKYAVEQEREACAVIAEEWFCGCGRGSCPEGDRRAHDIADSIRARGEA